MKKISKNKNFSSGFSLIELLVGIAIIITASTVIFAIIISSFRINSKSISQDILRQNGNFALSQIARTLQFADSFVGVSNLDTTDPAQFASCISAPTITSIQVIYNTARQTFSCTDSGGLKKNGITMINSSKITVVPGSCRITCTQDAATLVPVIGISYSLRFGNSTDTMEHTSVQNFSTSIKMRNR